MPEQTVDILDFQMGLKRIKDFSDPILITAMELALNVVRDSAQANHKKAPPTGHPDDRYYDRSGNLTKSIRADDVKVKNDVLTGDVLAGTPNLVEYAEGVEMGTPTSRAYPFLGPALSENENKIMIILDAGVKKVIG